MGAYSPAGLIKRVVVVVGEGLRRGGSNLSLVPASRKDEVGESKEGKIREGNSA